MTLNGIMKQALRQMDEDEEDISEYEELFAAYANMGYALAVMDYLKPRMIYALTTDERGCADIEGMGIVRVISMKESRTGDGATAAKAEMSVPFEMSGDGTQVITGRRKAVLDALCEIGYPPMEEATDEPRLPAFAHAALADYICYRHLSSGSLAKQSRAQFFLNSFLMQMRAVRAKGLGSVTRMKYLYEATGV